MAVANGATAVRIDGSARTYVALSTDKLPITRLRAFTSLKDVGNDAIHWTESGRAHVVAYCNGGGLATDSISNRFFWACGKGDGFNWANAWGPSCFLENSNCDQTVRLWFK